MRSPLRELLGRLLGGLLGSRDALHGPGPDCPHHHALAAHGGEAELEAAPSTVLSGRHLHPVGLESSVLLKTMKHLFLCKTKQ